MCLNGCLAPRNRIVSDKSTVFGLEIAYKDVKVRFGLIRNFNVSVPTSTNKVFAAPFSTGMDADLKLTSQKANEQFSTMEPANTGTNYSGKVNP